MQKKELTKPLVNNTKEVSNNDHEKVKEGVKIIEAKYQKLVGDYIFIIDILSDGTCQAGAKAAVLLCLDDKECKLELAREENSYLLNNFEFYKESLSYPHSIKIGLGENMTFQSEADFKTFLALNLKATFMWGDEIQLQITANMHSLRINVLKISPDGEGTLNIILPDSRLDTNSDNTKEYKDIC